MNRVELIDKINGLGINQINHWEDTEFPEEIQEVLNGCDIVEEGLDVDKHRWYETSVVVYQIGDEYFGITYVTDLFSESMSISDCSWEIVAFPMTAIQITSYVNE